MKIYHYEKTTKELLGSSIARPDPMSEGQFLIPANATPIEPPALVANSVAVFLGESWELRDDFRGTDYWLAYGDKHTVIEIGETVPAGAFLSEPEKPALTIAEIQVAKLVLVQSHMDAAAQARGYDDIKTAVTYADEPAVAKFQTEGQAFRAWRSLVWARCHELLAEVVAELRPIPTDAELIALLPALELPAQ